MATNATNPLSYCATLPKEQLDLLGAIRLWPTIKMATERERIWLTDLNYAQIHSLEIKRIPFIKIYVIRENKLFPLQSRLPIANYPTLLWTPIQRALKVELLDINLPESNIKNKVSLALIPSQVEHHASCCIVEIANLKEYLRTASQIRLQKIKWVRLNNSLALLYGSPLLPLPGTAYYRTFDFLLPCGYELELQSIQDGINNKINPDSSHWVVWHTDGTYALIEKEALQPLSRSSFRLTEQKLLIS